MTELNTPAEDVGQDTVSATDGGENAGDAGSEATSASVDTDEEVEQLKKQNETYVRRIGELQSLVLSGTNAVAPVPSAQEAPSTDAADKRAKAIELLAAKQVGSDVIEAFRTVLEVDELKTDVKIAQEAQVATAQSATEKQMYDLFILQNPKFKSVDEGFVYYSASKVSRLNPQWQTQSDPVAFVFKALADELERALPGGVPAQPEPDKEPASAGPTRHKTGKEPPEPTEEDLANLLVSGIKPDYRADKQAVKRLD